MSPDKRRYLEQLQGIAGRGWRGGGGGGGGEEVVEVLVVAAVLVAVEAVAAAPRGPLHHGRVVLHEAQHHPVQPQRPDLGVPGGRRPLLLLPLLAVRGQALGRGHPHHQPPEHGHPRRRRRPSLHRALLAPDREQKRHRPPATTAPSPHTQQPPPSLDRPRMTAAACLV
jgi:hypothetical protein